MQSRLSQSLGFSNAYEEHQFWARWTDRALCFVVCGMMVVGVWYASTTQVSNSFLANGACCLLVLWPGTVIHRFRIGSFVVDHLNRVAIDADRAGRLRSDVEAAKQRFLDMRTRSSIRGGFFVASATGREKAEGAYYLLLATTSIRPTLYERLWHEFDHHCDAMEAAARGCDDFADELHFTIKPARVAEIESSVRAHTPPEDPLSRLVRDIQDEFSLSVAQIVAFARDQASIGVLLLATTRVVAIIAALAAIWMLIQASDRLPNVCAAFARVLSTSLS